MKKHVANVIHKIFRLLLAVSYFASQMFDGLDMSETRKYLGIVQKLLSHCEIELLKVEVY